MSLFQGLGPEFASALAKAVEPVHFSAHQVCLREGDRSDYLFVILSGAVRVLPRGTEASKNAAIDLGSGACVGEVGFLTCDKRSATVSTLNESCLSETFAPGVRRSHPALPARDRGSYEPIVLGASKIHLSSALRRSELFGSVDAQVLKDLEAAARIGGSSEWRDSVSPWRTGRCDVSDYCRKIACGPPQNENSEGKEKEKEKVLAELHPGDTFGEMAVLTGDPRSASVYAFRDTS